jgi:phthiodiolone/phenolphthiodiolone dimycocerosates ketoreductase
MLTLQSMTERQATIMIGAGEAKQVTPYGWKRAEGLARLEDQLKTFHAGRDPDDFQFGVWFMALVHEDDEVIRQAMYSPFMRWMAGMYGRLEMKAWREEGLEPPLPDDWHYATKLLPVIWSDADVEHLLANVSDEMTERSFVHGTPDEVAAIVQSYVDAGATWVSACDILPLALEPEDAQRGLARNIEICRRLRRRRPS